MCKHFILLFFLITCLYGSKTIKKTDLKIYDQDVVFSTLWEDTYVCLINRYTGEIIAEFNGYLKKDVLESNKIMLDSCKSYYTGQSSKEIVCTYLLNEQIYFFEDKDFNDTAGVLIKMPGDYIVTIKDEGEYFALHLSGITNPKHYKPYNPWDECIKNLHAKKNIFNLSYDQIKAELEKSDIYTSPIGSDKIEYCHNYECGLPSPGIVIFYIFQDRKLIGIWTEFKLSGLENLPVENGFFNISKNSLSLKDKIIKDLIHWLNYSP